MNKNLSLILVIIALSINILGQSVVNKSGNIITNETWATDTVKVTSDIIIEEGSSLTILPGTYIEFQGHYKLLVFGKLIANGTKNKKIIFSAKNKNLTNSDGGWHGIRFYDNKKDISKISFSTIEYGNAFGKSDNEKSGGAIFIKGYKNVFIQNCIIRNNRAERNGGGVCFIEHNSFFYNNIISNNKSKIGGGGIYLNRSKSKFVNNTIICNSSEFISGGGLYSIDSDLELVNTILYTNKLGILTDLNTSQIGTFQSRVKYFHCNIEGYIKDKSLINFNSNISEDPKFISFLTFEIANNSPCVDAGELYESSENINFTQDVIGQNRVYNNRIDIGATEFNNSNYFMNYQTIILGYNRKLKIDVAPIGSESTVMLSLKGNFPVSMILKNNHILWKPSRKDIGKTYEIKIVANNSNVIKEFEIKLFVIDKVYTLNKKLEGTNMWMCDTIKVYNDIVVQNHETLEIKPNTCIEFQNSSKLNIQGRILAVGLKDRQIVFTAKNKILSETGGGWRGIRFEKTKLLNKKSKLINCTIEYGNVFTNLNLSDESRNSRSQSGGAIFVEKFNNLEITDCKIINNRAVKGGGIALYNSSDVEISKNIISNNIADYGGGVYSFKSKLNFNMNDMIDNEAINGGGLYCELESGMIKNNKISYNRVSSDGGAIYSLDCFVSIINNVISENIAKGDGGGISYISDKLDVDSKIINNTIVDNMARNGGGVYCDNYSTNNIAKPEIINTILWNNKATENGNQHYEFYGAKPHYLHCNIDNGISNENGAVDVIGNINVDPGFTYSSQYPYQLLSDSQCLDAGNSKVLIGKLKANYDIAGNIRILDDKIDIGAYEGGYINSDYSKKKSAFIEMGISPNPVSSIIKVKYTLTSSVFIDLKLYSINGALVKSVLNEIQTAGDYEKFINVQNLPKGIYLIYIKVGEEVDIKRIVKM